MKQEIVEKMEHHRPFWSGKNANDPLIAGNMMDQFPHPYSERTEPHLLPWLTVFEPQRFSPLKWKALPAEASAFTHKQTFIEKKCRTGLLAGQKFLGARHCSGNHSPDGGIPLSTFDIDRIFARPFGSNLASQRVLEKCGFMLEARIEKSDQKRRAGRWTDLFPQKGCNNIRIKEFKSY